MSRLEELIAELCPDGVENISLGEVLDYEQPTKYIVSSSTYDDKFNIPVLTAGKTFILGYTNDVNGIYNASKEKPVIIFDDFTTSIKWVDFKFKIKSSAMKILKQKKNYNLRYIFYCMENIQYSTMDHARQWIDKYSKINIPFPPLSIQNEIVRILDTFTQLTTELTAELSKRKQQYQYYRDFLLTFDARRPTSQTDRQTSIDS